MSQALRCHVVPASGFAISKPAQLDIHQACLLGRQRRRPHKRHSSAVLARCAAGILLQRCKPDRRTLTAMHTVQAAKAADATYDNLKTLRGEMDKLEQEHGIVAASNAEVFARISGKWGAP